MLVVGITIYIVVTKYTKAIVGLDTQLADKAQLPVEFFKDMLNNLRMGIIYIFILETIVLLIMSILLSMYFAHRLMGPLKRIEKEINEMTSGEIELRPLSLRKGDYLEPLIEVMNILINVVAKKTDLVEEYKHALINIKTIIKEESSS